MIAGYEQYKNRRLVVDNTNGIETAKSDVNNIFISPSVKIEHIFKLHKSFELRPNASASYTSSFFGSSNETGTSASNLSVKSCNARIFNSKAGVLATFTLMDNYKLNLDKGVRPVEIKGSGLLCKVWRENRLFTL